VGGAVWEGAETGDGGEVVVEFVGAGGNGAVAVAGDVVVCQDSGSGGVDEMTGFVDLAGEAGC